MKKIIFLVIMVALFNQARAATLSRVLESMFIKAGVKNSGGHILGTDVNGNLCEVSFVFENFFWNSRSFISTTFLDTENQAANFYFNIFKIDDELNFKFDQEKSIISFNQMIFQGHLKLEVRAKIEIQLNSKTLKDGYILIDKQNGRLEKCNFQRIINDPKNRGNLLLYNGVLK